MRPKKAFGILLALVMLLGSMPFMGQVAQAAPETCTVTFETNGGPSVAAQTITKGGKAGRPEAPVMEGYELWDWYSDPACTTRFDFSQAIDTDTVIYAYWVKTVSGVKLHGDGTTQGSDGYYKINTDTLEVLFAKDSANVKIEISPLAADYNTANKLTEPPEKGTAYYFHVILEDLDGEEGKPTVFYSTAIKTGTAATVENATVSLEELSRSPGGSFATLIFKYTEDPAAAHTVTFESNGGSAVDPQEVEDGGKAEKPADPTRDGYWFTAWCTDEDLQTEYDFSQPVTSDLTLYAMWTIKPPVATTFVISYDLNGGTLDGETGVITVEVEKGATITLPKPTREGYTFDYWKGSRYKAGASYTVEEDHTFTAQWKQGGAPQTGDESHMGLWIALMAVSFFGFGIILLGRRRSAHK